MSTDDSVVVDRRWGIPEPPGTHAPTTCALLDLADGLLCDLRTLEAIETYAIVLRREPWNVRALHRCGEYARQQGDADLAWVYCQRILKHAPDLAESHLFAAQVLYDLRRFEGGLDHCRRALELPSIFLGEVLTCIARSLQQLGEHDAAAGVYAELADAADVPSEMRVDARMILGRVHEAHADYRATFPRNRVGINHTFAHAFSARGWDGSPLNGRTLLVCGNEGNGDVIERVRFLRQVRRHGRVILAVRPALARLFQRSGLADVVLAFGDGVPAHDVRTLLSFVPLDTTSLYEGAYLPSCQHELAGRVRDLERPRVGIVWAGDPKHLEDRFRSMPHEALRRLVETAPRLSWVSLQVGPRAIEGAELSAIAPVLDLSSHLTDYAATSAAIGELDLVITVDTSVAHLAGAMGKPVWTMLAAAPDGRWMLGRSDTPWYPTMRLFRLPWHGAWCSTAEAVGRELVRHFEDVTDVPDERRP
jgi:hypothetical protein